MSNNHANVKITPPLIPLAAILVSWLINKYLYTLTIPIDSKAQSYIATSCMSLALILFISSLYFFIKSKQNPEPHTPTNSLYTKGIFQWTRNPIYLGFLFAQIVVAVKFNNLYMIISLPAIIYFLTVLVIQPEEEYLEQLFAEDYLNYKTKVRRWI